LNFVNKFEGWKGRHLALLRHWQQVVALWSKFAKKISSLCRNILRPMLSTNVERANFIKITVLEQQNGLV